MKGKVGSPQLRVDLVDDQSKSVATFAEGQHREQTVDPFRWVTVQVEFAGSGPLSKEVAIVGKGKLEEDCAAAAAAPAAALDVIEPPLEGAPLPLPLEGRGLLVSAIRFQTDVVLLEANFLSIW